MSSRTTPDAAWEEPVNLGPPINGTGADGTPNLSPDGLTMYFSSARAGGFGEGDLWMSQRSGPDSEWSEPVNLGTAINTPDGQSDPEISADGLTILFSGYVNGTEGPHILWMASRSALDQPFGHRRSWGGPLDRWATAGSPTITDDGRQLFFHSNYQGSRSWDLWWTQRIPR
jgi:Tol biopolymer transport system component